MRLQLLLDSGILHLFIICLAVLAIVFLFLKSKVNEDCKKIHLLYISGILIFLIIELVSYICVLNDADGKSITSYVSFASTLSSLILSVVAIIYTIVTNSKGEDVFAKLSNKTDTMQKIGENMESVSKGIIEKLTLFELKIQDISTIAKDTNATVKLFSNNVKDTELPESGISMDDVVKQMVYTGSIMGNSAILACCYAKEQNKTINLTVLFKNDEEYIYGYLISVSTLSFISIEIDNHIVTVSEVYQGLKEIIQQFFLRMNAEKSVKNLEIIEKIQNYFGITEKFWKPENNRE